MAGEKEIWQRIGEGFVQEYYNQFDNTNRMQLGLLYLPCLLAYVYRTVLDIHDKSIVVSQQRIEATNVAPVVQTTESDNSDEACLTWEGEGFRGRDAITGKLVSLPFKRIKHILTEQDIQPTIDSCILIMVFGQLQADDDPPMAFHQVFMLKAAQNCSWACTNDMFRLGLHNIPV